MGNLECWFITMRCFSRSEMDRRVHLLGIFFMWLLFYARACLSLLWFTSARVFSFFCLIIWLLGSFDIFHILVIFLFSCFITDRKEVSFWAYWKEVSFLLLCFVPGFGYNHFLDKRYNIRFR